MEDTKVTIASVEQQMVTAEKAAEPGDAIGASIEAPKEIPGMTVTELISAGYTYIYDTETRERSLTNNNMLRTQLLKKRPNGKPVFTTIKPATPAFRGTIKCMLHPDDPNRGHYDELGLSVCRKSNLTSPFQLRRHMEKRHKMELATIEMEKKEDETKRDRKAQDAMRKALEKLAK
jgi:hypothetical protein